MHIFYFFYLYPFFSPISWYPIVVVATILSHRYNSRTGSGETKVECRASSDTQPDQPHCFLTQRASNRDDARPIVRCPTDLPVAAGYDRAWAEPRDSDGTLMAQPLTTAPPGRPHAHY